MDGTTRRNVDRGSEAGLIRGECRASFVLKPLEPSARRVYDIVRMALRSGTIERDGQLVEDSLVTLLGESRGAVREALQLLATEGMVLRRPGRGTRVARPLTKLPVAGELIPLRRDLDDLLPEQRMVIYQLERRLVRPSDPVRARLEVEGDAVLLLDQLLFLDSEPVGVRTTYLSVDRALEEVLGAITDSTHHPQAHPALFKAMYGVEPGDSDVTLEAIAAGTRTARILDIREGTPMLLVETLRRDSSGRPRILWHAHLRGDRFALFTSGPSQ